MPMIKIPFQVGDPVTEENFADRKEILSELTTNILSLKKGIRQDFAIISPRRMGKSSILLTLSNKLEDKLACVYIDCSKLYPFNIINFLQTYSKEIYSVYSKKLGWKLLPEKITEAIRGIGTSMLEVIQKIGVEFEDIKIWLEFKEKRVSETELIEKVLNLPEKFAKKKGIPFLIILDEFQELKKFGPDFLRYLRGTIIRHKHVDYIVSGSATTIMEQLAMDKKSPFYNLFLVKHIDALPEKEAKKFLEKKFKGFNYKTGALEQILELTKSHPFYLQWLARSVFIHTFKNKKFTKEDVKKIYMLSISEPSGHFEYELAKIKEKGKYMDIILIIAKYNAKTPSKIGKYLNVQAGEVSPYLKRLIELGFLKKKQGQYEFIDLILKEWVKHRYG